MRYLNFVAERFDLKRDIQFNTRVVAAHYDEAEEDGYPEDLFVQRKLRSAKLSGMSDQFEGSCLCGTVRFVATGQPESVAWCHCESCRKHSGAPVSVFVAFKRNAYVVTEGHITKFNSSPGRWRGFCVRCGSTLTCEGERSNETHFHIGAFSDAAQLQPTRHIFPEERLAWLHLGGLNFRTLRPRREIFADYRKVVERVYGIDAFYSRVRTMASMLQRPPRRSPYPGPQLAGIARDLKLLGRLLWHIARREPQAFLHLVRAFYAARRNPGAFGAIFTMAAMYLHLGPFSRHVIAMLDQRIDAADEEEAFLALPARADVDAEPILALTDGC